MGSKPQRHHLRRETYMAKNGDVAKQWRIIDAQGVSLGRLAAEIAPYLMGKHRPEYTPHVDCGDFVIVINAGKVGLTGNKADQNLRLTYSGYPGGQSAESYGNLRERRSDVLVSESVRRMLPKSRLGRQMLKKLKVYDGADHPHAGVNPTAI